MYILVGLGLTLLWCAAIYFFARWVFRQSSHFERTYRILLVVFSGFGGYSVGVNQGGRGTSFSVGEMIAAAVFTVAPIVYAARADRKRRSQTSESLPGNS
jgi:hypothetical protein